MILQARHLRKAYFYPKKLEVLKDISLNIETGESVAIMGKSGEGKTTLLHILGTLEEADGGVLEIAGQIVRPSSFSELRSHHLGFIFQSHNLLEDFTALENVLMPARIARRFASKQHGLELLEKVGMQEKAHHPAKLLSGGEKQRVAIARALCNDPDLILADEPSGNLDPVNAKAIIQLLLELVKKKKKSLCLVTHDAEFAEKCDRTYLLKDGCQID